MSTISHIIDDKLPISQDFKMLKDEGLAFIQKYIGNQWTNFNPSDPGVTILDQVCYALTELGYCNDFPVEDILTLPNGQLQLNNQFYLPQNILTTSPVTAQDYIKYIVDGVTGVKNAVIIPAVVNNSKSSNIYQVYLLIDTTVTDPTGVNNICQATFFYLNKCRNLGELFLKPVLLTELPYFITGKVYIEDENELNTVVAGMERAIRNYIFPAAMQAGYQQLVQSGFDINEIFNGPLLQNGWIPTSNLGKKRDQLAIIELISVISGVSGVKSVTGLSFENTSPLKSQPNEILVINLVKLEIYCNGRLLTNGVASQFNRAPAKTQLSNGIIQLGASIQVQTDVPTGKFRDINNYYSIQNTFPEVFAVGSDATIANASDFQIAQSRQLKGYLTLFDQVLANQFSQLANIGRLFSFKNASTGTPSDEAEFYAVKDDYEKTHPEYPVPYKAFSPTYFYQSLYHIPHIRPLLKGNGIFNFSTEIESRKDLEQKGWDEYKLDPYNPYIWGLMEFVEDEKDGLVRRNKILDHLLARHGESPMLIDMIINGSLYSGDSIKDRVIFKSLYLQNIGLLSYNRQKAYNYLGANKIANDIKIVPLTFERHILGSDSTDFIFNSEKIDRLEQLNEKDFIHYSATELKLCMLFGLKVQYKDFISANYRHHHFKEETEMALWMIQQRKGAIFIEMDLLLQNAEFEIRITEDTDSSTYRQINESLSYGQFIAVTQTLLNSTPEGFNAELAKGAFNICGSDYTLGAPEPFSTRSKHHNWIAGTDYFFTVVIRYSNGTSMISELSFENDPVFSSRVEIILPAFIPQFNTMAFQNRLNLFLQNEFPAQINYRCHFVTPGFLKELIPVFASWHNTLVYDTDSELPCGGANYSDAVLAKLLNGIEPNEIKIDND